MKRKIEVFVWVLSLFLLAGKTVLSATIYYVSPEGNDMNDGANLSSPFRNIQKAAGLMKAGDYCYIREGTYHEEVTPTHSGR